METKLDILIDQYAQNCVDDMELDTLMEIVKEGIEHRLQDLPENDVLAEIGDSEYPHLIEKVMG